MSESNTSARRLPSTATMALIAAGLVLVVSAGVAVLRSDGDSNTVTSPHGAVQSDQAAGTLEQSIAQVAERLKRDPDNAADWRMLGWSYFETGDLNAAAGAYRRAAEVEPNNAENWSSLGEAIQRNSTRVEPEAASAFARALKIDAKDPRARYFAAVQKDLNGDHQGAIDDWIAMLRDAPAGAVYEADVRRTINQVAEKEGLDIAGRLPPPSAGSVATAAIPGPTAEQLASASSIPPGEQDEMVKGMLARLEGRLKDNPKDADGWIRLMRSRMVLNDPKAARAALDSGLAAFRGDSATQGRLRQAAQELSVPGGG